MGQRFRKKEVVCTKCRYTGDPKLTMQCDLCCAVVGVSWACMVVVWRVCVVKGRRAHGDVVSVVWLRFVARLWRVLCGM